MTNVQRIENQILKTVCEILLKREIGLYESHMHTHADLRMLLYKLLEEENKSTRI